MEGAVSVVVDGALLILLETDALKQKMKEDIFFSSIQGGLAHYSDTPERCPIGQKAHFSHSPLF